MSRDEMDSTESILSPDRPDRDDPSHDLDLHWLHPAPSLLDDQLDTTGDEAENDHSMSHMHTMSCRRFGRERSPNGARKTAESSESSKIIDF